MAKRKNTLPLPILLLLAVLLLGLGFLGYRAIRQALGSPVIRTQDDVPRVRVREAYEAVQSGEAVLVDTRLLVYYDAGHAEGAISLPVNEVEARLDELDPTRWVITYCT